MKENIDLSYRTSEHYRNVLDLQDDLSVTVQVFSAYGDPQNLEEGFQIVEYTFEEDVEDKLLEFRERCEEFYDENGFPESPFYPVVGGYGDTTECTLHIEAGTEPIDMVSAAQFADNLIRQVHEEIGF